MNPKYAKQLQNLAWIGVRPKDRDGMRPENAISVNPEHTVYIRIGDGEDPVTFVGQKEDTFKPIDLKDPMHRVIINRSYLRSILDNLSSDSVVLDIDDGYPLRIIGNLDDTTVTAYIAPIIENE